MLPMTTTALPWASGFVALTGPVPTGSAPRVAPAGQVATADSAVQPPVAEGATCASLPSSVTAYDVVRGVPGSWIYLARDWGLRGALIGGGLFVAGVRQGLVRLSLSASAFIEMFVLAWAWWKTRHERAAARRAPQPVAS